MRFKDLWNFIQDRLAQTIFHPQYFYKTAEAMTIKELKKVAGGNFLDVGCGRQWYRPVLEPLFTKYFALEKKSNKNLYDSPFPIEIWGEASNIALKNNSIDIIQLAGVLEFLPEPYKVLKELKRVLSNNGKLIIIVGDNYPAHALPLNFGHYTGHGLRALLKNGEFEPITVRPVGNFWETQAIYVNVFIMEKIKHLIFNNQKVFVGLVLFGLAMPLMVLNNLIAIVLGRRISTEEFALGHIVVAKVS